ncbi:histidine phosphatase family protein [Reinekea marina]|uniref:Histidine phosphatase family protein n=1 Tax=Reinekea marina TaxID=1310421 RepID=A0ABV7WTS9_9GAMM
MEIFLLRHAETETNREGGLATGSDDALTEHGHHQAQSIIEGLLALEIDSILSSPYPRALETVRPFSEFAKKNIEVHSCLAEGQLLLSGSHDEEEPKYFSHGAGYDYPSQNETGGAFLARVRRTKEVILSQPCQRILVVTHGHMLRELINNILALPHKVRFPHENCGLTHVTIGEVIMVNCINRPMCFNK